MTITEEDVIRYREAKTCNDCPGWHKHCNAECCKVVKIIVDLKTLEKGFKYLTIKPNKPLGLSDIIYYRLRGVQYMRGLLRFQKDRIEVIGRNVYYYHPCSKLKGNFCEDHPHKKPLLCKSLTLETANLPGQPFAVTDNCLFKYKEKGGVNNGEKRRKR